MDLATNGSLPIFRNLPKLCLFLHRQVENNNKNENGFVRVLHKLLHSVQMTAYLCLMTIYDVAICQPHRFLPGSAHDLHTDEHGNDGGNEWYGSSTMCDVADAIYLALDALITHPKKIVDQSFMMSIFDRWLKKTVSIATPAATSAPTTDEPPTTYEPTSPTPANTTTTAAKSSPPL